MSAPALTVVVPATRPVRLRWLLVALSEQTSRAFEVVVVHEEGDARLAAVVCDHPEVRAVTVAAGTGSAARQRNAGWRAARAATVAFTDDDCRPPERWIANLLDAVRAHPGAVVQGAVRPDPDEVALVQRAPHARTLTVDPPVPWGQTANIAYPRAVLERLEGFDERLPAPAGEDTDLAQRAVEAGVPYAGAPEAVTFHAVEPRALPTHLRSLWRWQHVAYVVKRHPRLRAGLPGRGLFWKTRHARFVLALAGLAGARRWPAALAFAAPWVHEALPAYGSSPRGRLRAVSELPGRAAVDAVEVAALVRGSVRYRTVLL